MGIGWGSYFGTLVHLNGGIEFMMASLAMPDIALFCILVLELCLELHPHGKRRGGRMCQIFCILVKNILFFSPVQGKKS